MDIPKIIEHIHNCPKCGTTFDCILDDCEDDICVHCRVVLLTNEIELLKNRNQALQNTISLLRDDW
jgi:hypothetical protein